MGELFWKTVGGPHGQHRLATEHAGLHWLRVPGGPPIPDVIARRPTALGLVRVPQEPASPTAARELGRRLAAMHAAGAPAFGAPPPAAPGPDGWVADLPMAYASDADFAPFWAARRLEPTARRARQVGGLERAGATLVDRLCRALRDGQVDVGPAEPPARIHGDLWSGNVLWGSDGQAWVIDPAAHGGHRESDLAMLALFGAPHLEHVLAGYDEVAPLAAGWRERTPLHQAWPLLVHAALFGGGYGQRAMVAARKALG